MAESPIFVVGTGRSGTTLLRYMLCAHPRIYVAHEISFYVCEKVFAKPRASTREFLETYFFPSPAFRWLRVDPARVLAQLPEDATRGAAFAAVMRAKAEQYGRVRFGDKTPSHTAFVGRIFADFPDARVIHIVRDPRATALSLSQMPWASPSLWTNAVVCKNDLAQVRKYDDRVLRVRLEDLLADPRATMTRVLEHVGEPWDDAVLDHHNTIPDKHDMPPFPWLETASQKRGAKGVDWRSLSPVHIRMIERTARNVMTECGYEPAKLEREPGGLAVRWAAMRELPEMFRALDNLNRMTKLGRDPKNFDSEEGKLAWKRVNPAAWARYPGFEIPDAPPLIR